MLSGCSHCCPDMHLPIASRKGYYIYCRLIWNEKQDAAHVNGYISCRIFLGRKCIRSGYTFKDKKMLKKGCKKDLKHVEIHVLFNWHLLRD